MIRHVVTPLRLISVISLYGTIYIRHRGVQCAEMFFSKLKIHKMSFTRKEYDEEGPRKSYTPAQAKVKIAVFCAYQKQYQKKIRNKLYNYGLSSSDVEKVLTTMILEGFINKEHFAKAFV